MDRRDPEDPLVRQEVRQFCDHVFQLKLTHHIYRELYEDEHAKYLMEKTAHHFFFDIGNMVIDYLLLEIVKLSDPAQSFGGRRENFSIANLLETVAWPEDFLAVINPMLAKVNKFREYIQDARNRLLAHYDKETVLAKLPVGGFPPGADEEVVATLEAMANAFHKASHGEILGHFVTFHEGDVTDLKKALRMAIAFDDMFTSAADTEVYRLAGILQRVDDEAI